MSSTKEQLSGYVDSCSRLQEELKVCNASLVLFAFIPVTTYKAKGSPTLTRASLPGKDCYNREAPGATSQGSLQHQKALLCSASPSRVNISTTLSPQGTSADAGEAQTFQLREKLTEAQNEAATTKEELSCCKESLEKLQELLQVRSCLHVAASCARQLLPVLQRHIVHNRMQFDLLQEREMTIAQLKAELFEVSVFQLIMFILNYTALKEVLSTT